MPKPCSRCGAPGLELFTSIVCSASCDQLPKDVKLVRRHKMDLGEGWVLWTSNETPPQGWTHVRIFGASGTSEYPRPTVERFSTSSAGSAWGMLQRGQAEGYRSVSDIEGFAYKVP